MFYEKFRVDVRTYVLLSICVSQLPFIQPWKNSYVFSCLKFFLYRKEKVHSISVNNSNFIGAVFDDKLKKKIVLKSLSTFSNVLKMHWENFYLSILKSEGVNIVCNFAQVSWNRILVFRNNIELLLIFHRLVCTSV